MKKNTYFTILLTLSTKEYRLFTRYLLINYPSQKNLMPIHRFYERYYHKQKEPPEIKIAYQKIFGPPPTVKKQYAKLQNGLSDLAIKLKDFLIELTIRDDTFEKELYWQRVLEERGLFHQQNLQEKNCFTKIDKQSTWRGLQELQLHHLLYYTNHRNKSGKDGFRITSAVAALDHFYTTMQLKLGAELENQRAVIDKGSINQNMQQIISKTENTLEHQPLITQYYYHLYLMNEQDTNETFERFNEFWKEHHTIISVEDLSIGAIYLINYVQNQIRKGKFKLVSQAFEIYQLGIHQKLFIHKGILDKTIYDNVVNIGCLLKKWNWVKEFAENFQDYLLEAIRQETFQMSKVIIAYSKKDFKQVQELLSIYLWKDIFQELRAKTLLLISFYELEEIETLEFHTETFIRWVKRNKKLGENNRLAATNFAKILRMIYTSKKTTNQIQTEIKQKKQLFYRKWLLEKIGIEIEI